MDLVSGERHVGVTVCQGVHKTDEKTRRPDLKSLLCVMLGKLRATLPIVFNRELRTTLPIVFNRELRTILPIVFNRELRKTLPIVFHRELRTTLPIVFNRKLRRTLPIVFNRELRTALPIVFNRDLAMIQHPIRLHSDKDLATITELAQDRKCWRGLTSEIEKAVEVSRTKSWAVKRQ